jgi:cAMP receptor-like G-protein coupled receptor
MNTTELPNHTNHEVLLTDDQLHEVSIVKTAGSILSIIGTSFIITIYIYLSFKLRDNKDKHMPQVSNNSKELANHNQYKKLKMGFGHNLIFLLSLSDFLYGISAFIKTSGFSHKEADVNLIDGQCVAQGFLINFSEVSSICWTTMISMVIYLGTITDITKISKIYFYFFLYSYGLPLILSFGPLITESFGPAGAWCWMNTQNLNNNPAWIWALVIYIFTWINIIFNIFAVWKTIGYFQIRAFEVNEEGNKKEYNFLKNFCIVLKFFPMILILCWFFPTVNRIYTFFSHRQNFYLYSLHIFFSSCTGFLNSIVYSYYYRNFIPCLSCFNFTPTEDILEIADSCNDTKKEINLNISNTENYDKKFELEKNNSLGNQDFTENFTEIEMNNSYDSRCVQESKNSIN